MFWKAVVRSMLGLLVLSMLTLAFPIQPVKADGTSQINVDGSISPSTAPISSVRQVTRAFTGDIHESIDVQRKRARLSERILEASQLGLIEKVQRLKIGATYCKLTKKGNETFQAMADSAHLY